MDDREDKIRARAYEIWERDGKQSGHHDRHWSQATDEVDGEAQSGPLGDILNDKPISQAAQPDDMPPARSPQPKASRARPPKTA